MLLLRVRLAQVVLLLLLSCSFFNYTVKAQGIYQFWGTAPEGGPDDIGGIYSTDTLGVQLKGHHLFSFRNYGSFPSGQMAVVNGKLYGLASPMGRSNKSVLYELDPSTGTYTIKHIINAESIYTRGLTSFNNELYGIFSASPSGKTELFKYNPATDVYTGLRDLTGIGGSNLLLFNNKFYTLSSEGGSTPGGAVFEYDPQTNVYTRKADLSAADGLMAYGSLVAYGSKLYGMTAYGPTSRGVIFEFDPATSAILKKISLTEQGGGMPMSDLVQYDNKLWGTTWAGGANDKGTLFQYDPVANIYAKKIDFSASTGYFTAGNLAVIGNKLLGLQGSGGLHNGGTLFEYDPATNQYDQKVNFSDSTGIHPDGAPVVFNNRLYASAGQGGTYQSGVLFEYEPLTANYVKKIELGASDGGYPNGSLTSSGNSLFGVTFGGGSKGFGTLFRYEQNKATYSVEVSFDTTIGSFPMGDLVALNGELYGMAIKGGTYNKGVLFSYNPVSKTYHQWVDFDSLNGGFLLGYPFDGYDVEHTVRYSNNLVAYNNKLYGLTQNCGLHNFGVIFEFDPVTHVYTKKIDFDSTGGDGPTGGLVMVNNKFYGMTIWGGAYDQGVIFEYDPASNVYTKKMDMQQPATFTGSGYLAVIGNKIYGTTRNDGDDYTGLLFEYDPLTNNYQKKYDFVTATGSEPGGGLLVKNGLLYGTTESGGTFNKGVVYSYDPVLNTYSKRSDFDSSATAAGSYYSTLVSIPAVVADGLIGSCQALPPFSVNNAENHAWKAITGNFGEAIAELNPNGNDLGNINASLYVQTNPARAAGGLNYLNRSLTITVQHQPAPGQPVYIRLYIKKSEVDDLINTPGSGVTSVNDLVVYKSEDPCGNSIGNDLVKLTTAVSEWGGNYVLSTQVTSFSTFHFAAVNSPLPVRLIDFTAMRKNKTDNLLAWQTSSELNSRNFNIERSVDGVNFVVMGTVPAAGNSTLKRQYNYTDANAPLNTMLYYRLKMVDKDGAFTSSKVIKLMMTGSAVPQVSPNPVGNVLMVTGIGQFKDAQIIDANGRVVRTWTLTAGQPYNVEGIRAGIYTVRLVNNTEVRLLKFLKL